MMKQINEENEKTEIVQKRWRKQNKKLQKSSK